AGEVDEVHDRAHRVAAPARDGQALLVHGASRQIVSLAPGRRSHVVQRGSEVARIAQLAVDGEALLEAGARGRVIVTVHGHDPEALERARNALTVARARGELQALLEPGEELVRVPEERAEIAGSPERLGSCRLLSLRTRGAEHALQHRAPDRELPPRVPVAPQRARQAEPLPG